MSTVQGTDEVLVNRNNQTYTQPQSTLMAKLDKNDLLLVNRSNQTYTVSGEDFINSVVDPISLEVSINPSTPTIGQEVTAIPVVTGGKAPAGGFVYTYQWSIADDAAGTNAVDISGATTNKYTPLASQETKYLGCKVTTTDFFGDSIEDTTYAGPVTSVQIAPDIQSVALTETVDGVNRYTSKEFPFATTMAVDGTPDPEYGLKVKLTGATFDFDVRSDKITDVESGGSFVAATSDKITKVISNVVLYPSSTTGTGINPDKAFDGQGLEGATYAGGLGAYTTSGSAYALNMGGISYTSSVELAGFCTYGSSGTTAARGYGINGSGETFAGFTKQFSTGATAERVTVLSGSGTLNSIEIYGSTAGNFTLTGVYVDGVLLVNPLTGSIKVELASNQNLGSFSTNDVVQDPYKIVGKNANSTPPYLLIDGGNWYADAANGGDGSGTVGGDTEVTKTTNYNAKVTLNSDKDLTLLNDTAVHMTLATNTDTKDGYTLTTSAITDIETNPDVTMSFDSSQTWSAAANFETTASSATYPYANMFNNAENVHYGNMSDSVTYPGSIIWNAPAGVNLSGDILLCSGPNTDSTVYSSPVVFVNDSTTPLEQLSTKGGVSYGFLVYRFANVGPVNKITIVGQIQYDSNNATQTQVPVMSLGVGDKWLLDPGTSETFTAVCPQTLGGGTSKILTFADPCPDLRYFEATDVVQTSPAEVKVVSKDVANRKMTVSGGDWGLVNTTNTWSDNATLSAPHPSAASAVEGWFDGNLTRGASGAVASTFSITNLGGLDGLVEIYTNSASGGNRSYSFTDTNGTSTAVADTSQANNSWFSIGTATGLTSIQGTSSGAYGIFFTAIRVNGVMLVDPVDERADWSSLLTNSTTFTGTKIEAFDGDVSTGPSMTGIDTTWTLDASQHFTDGNFQVYTWGYQKINVTDSNGTNRQVFGGTGGSVKGWWPTNPASFTDIQSIMIKPEGAASGNSNAVYAIKVNGKILYNSTLPDRGGQNSVTYATNGGEGTIVKVDGDDVYITNSGDRNSRWIADDNAAGTEFYIAPKTPVTDSKTTAYGVVAQVNGNINVTGIQKNEPEFADITSKDGTIKFPATFAGTGNPPDTDLPNGVSITATVFAENDQGDDEQDSNTLLPQAPNPTGSVGPITASTTTTITSANSANISGLTANDNLIMVDSQGSTATYQLQTAPIVKVESDTSGYKLTFNGDVANNKDLKFFKAADLVQNTAVQWDVTGAGKNEVNVTGDPFASSGRLSLNKAGVRITFTYPTPVDFSTLGITKFSGGGHNQASGYTMGFIDDAGNETSAAGTTASSWSVTNIPLTPPAKVKEFYIDGAGFSFGGWYTSASAFVATGTLTGGAEVVSTGLNDNPQTNTMIVSGGAWYANSSNGGDGSGDSTDGEEFVTFTPPSGTATFESANGSELTVSSSNDRWISNDNRLGTDFYVKKNIGRGLDASNPADVQIYQDIVAAFDAFPVKVNQRRTGIASSLYRLMAGQTLSAAEFELLEDTVTNAVNAQEPFALDGYYPLYYTSEKADAASSTSTHHTHTINGVEYYMPDGGTIYHGNYTS